MSYRIPLGRDEDEVRSVILSWRTCIGTIRSWTNIIYYIWIVDDHRSLLQVRREFSYYFTITES